MTFDELQTQVFDLYGEKKYAEIIPILEREMPNFPDAERDVSYWWLCIYALLGRTDDALRTLREGLDRGWWHSPNALRTDEDLVSLQAIPEYQELVERNSALQAGAQKSVQPKQIVHAPAGVAQPPLIIALHGNNNTAASTEEFWLPLVERGYLFAAMQSTQLGNRENVFVWNDYTQAKKDVEGYYAELKRDTTGDGQRIIFGGFSMGGQTAARLALAGTFGSYRFITVGGWMGADPELQYISDAIQALSADARRQVRGVIMIGEQDHGSYKGALKFAEILSAAGISHQLVVIPGIAHTYPKNYTEALLRAVQFVLE